MKNIGAILGMVAVGAATGLLGVGLIAYLANGNFPKE